MVSWGYDSTMLDNSRLSETSVWLAGEVVLLLGCWVGKRFVGCWRLSETEMKNLRGEMPVFTFSKVTNKCSTSSPRPDVSAGRRGNCHPLIPSLVSLHTARHQPRKLCVLRIVSTTGHFHEEISCFRSTVLAWT